jgi:hypothetical protein
MLGRTLHLTTLRPALLIAGLAGLLRGPSCGSVVATVVPPLHALRLRERWSNAQHHEQRSRCTFANRSPFHSRPPFGRIELAMRRQ